jgi:hypothetical protein
LFTFTSLVTFEALCKKGGDEEKISCQVLQMNPRLASFALPKQQHDPEGVGKALKS